MRLSMLGGLDHLEGRWARPWGTLKEATTIGHALTQQTAEFAIKALLHGLGLPAYGHSVSRLLTEAPRNLRVQGEIVQAAKTLDKYYVPTRYPNAWAEGTPEDYYTKEDAENAVKCAEAIINWVETLWRSLKGEGS